MPPGTHEWSFSFIFPESSKYSRPPTRPHSSRNSIWDQIYNSNPQPLPPTDYVMSSCGGHAEVSYTLTATMLPVGFTLNRPQSILELNLVPFSRSPLPQPSVAVTEAIRKKWGSPSMQSMSHIFTRDLILKTPLLAKLYIPTSATMLQPLSLAISLGREMTSPIDSEMPTLMLEKSLIRLKRYCRWRVKRHWFFYVFDDPEFHSKKLSTYELPSGKILPLDNTQTQITNPFRLADLPITKRWLKSSFGPMSSSFSTYNISVEYDLRLSVTLKHQESGRRFKFNWMVPFTILPPQDPKALQPVAYPGQPSSVDTSQRTASLAQPPLAQRNSAVAIV